MGGKVRALFGEFASKYWQYFTKLNIQCLSDYLNILTCMFCNKYEVEVYVGGQSGTFEGPSMELIKSMRTYFLLILLFLVTL